MSNSWVFGSDRMGSVEFQLSGKCVFAPKNLLCRRKIKGSETFFNFDFARKKLISNENNTPAFNYSDEKMLLLSGIANNVCLFCLHDRRNSRIFFKRTWILVCSSHAKPSNPIPDALILIKSSRLSGGESRTRNRGIYSRSSNTRAKNIATRTGDSNRE